MTRALLLSLLLAAPSAAQENLPLILSTGNAMDLFSVRAEPTAIDQTNPTGLAGAYARFLVEKHAAGGHFARLFTQGYRVILQRYYVASIAATAKVEGEGSELRCEVGPVRLEGSEKAIAELKHIWRPAKAAKPMERKIQVHMKVREGRWWIEKVLHEAKGGKGLENRGVGIPPQVLVPKVPGRVLPDRAAPKSAVRCLRDEMLRLAALTQKGRASLHAAYFRILGGFFGKQVAAEARAKQRAPRQPIVHDFEIQEPWEREGGLVRVEVLAMELVPGGEGVRSAIGRASFDLRKEKDGMYRIVRELEQPQADKPPRVRKERFAFLFVG
ncbi:MAG: hypothetical protein ACYTGV_17875 [Planctomycetota bacterium]